MVTPGCQLSKQLRMASVPLQFELRVLKMLLQRPSFKQLGQVLQEVNFLTSPLRFHVHASGILPYILCVLDLYWP